MKIASTAGRLCRFWQAALICLACATTAQAADFPTKPITFVVPAPPGGPTDILARLLGEDMRKAWGQPVVVENRPGAGSMIATHFVARAPADGHTLLLAFTNHLTNPALNPKAGYDPLKDFAPVTLLANAGAVLAIPASSEIKDWKDFLRYAKEKPGGISIGNVGAGSSTHIYAEMIRDATGLPIHPIPYKGEVDLQAALISGNLEAGLISIGPYTNLAKAGKLRGMATTLRSPLLPDMPTFSDLNVPGPGKVRGWFGVIAPAGTPSEITEKIARQMQQRLREPEVTSKLNDAWAFVLVGSTPQEFAKSLKAEYAEWTDAVKKYNIQLD